MTRQPSDWLRRWLHALGIDRVVAYALLGQGWTMLFQPITLLMIAQFLSPVEQGYFTTFGAMVGIQIFFDLGLAAVTLQFLSHEAGLLHWSEMGILAGDARAKSRLVSIAKLSMIWYLIVTLALSAVLLPIGWYFFGQRDSGGVSWHFAWIWTVVAANAGMLLIAPIQVLAACGKMAYTVRAQTIQKVIVNISQCAALALGASLLSWPLAQTLGFIVLSFWLIRYWRSAFRDLYRQPNDGPGVSWWGEVWPFQWRVALSGIATMVVYPLCTILLFDDSAASKIEAGKMGMSLVIMNVLISATQTWVGARVPTLGQLVARRDWVQLDRIFQRLLIQSTLVAGIAASAIWAVLIVLHQMGFEIGSRVLPAWPLALLLANAVVQHVVWTLACYLRAHKRDPFLWAFVAFGLCMAITVATIGRTYGATGMAASIFVLNATICLGAGSIIYARCRRAWHADVTPIAAMSAVDV